MVKITEFGKREEEEEEEEEEEGGGRRERMVYSGSSSESESEDAGTATSSEEEEEEREVWRGSSMETAMEEVAPTTMKASLKGGGGGGGGGGDGGQSKNWLVILDDVAIAPRWYERFKVRLGRGIIEDFQNRREWYVDDWRIGKVNKTKTGGDSGTGVGMTTETAVASGNSQTTDRPGLVKLLAPSTYIFLASFVPALAFGQQLSDKTSGKLGVVQVLASTCIAGFIQSVFGGQPLMIVGVAEPIVLIYGYMYKFAKKQDNLPFLPWASIVLIYTGILQMIIASINLCDAVHRITRFSGEIFGLLIAGLFLQQAITGLVQEFDDVENPSYAWRSVNGLWSLFLAFGLLYTALMLTAARGWRFFNSGIRRVLSDYGAALMVVVWTGVSYIPDGFPKNIPRRVVAPDLWDENNNGNWSILTKLNEVPAAHWASALVPAIIIVVLFYFDHNVSAQLASSGDMGVKKPKAFHYDFLIAGITNLLMGLLGLPPTNGVLPQSPMHTRALIYKVKANKKRKDSMLKMLKKTASSIRRAVSFKNVPVAVESTDGGSKSSHTKASHSGDDQGVSATDERVTFDVAETRVSNFAQSMFIFVTMFLTAAIRCIPRSVLWGYFAYMSIESLPGNQLWDRCLLMVTDPRRYGAGGGAGHENTQHLFIRTVKFKTIILFTLLQLALLGGLWGITQAGIFGVTFPLFIMSLVPLRDYVIPKIFMEADLEELDSPEAVDEVAADVPHEDPPSMLATAAATGSTTVADPPATWASPGDEEAGGRGHKLSSPADDSSSSDASDEDEENYRGGVDHYYTTGEFTGRAGHQLTKVATRRTAERRARRHEEALQTAHALQAAAAAATATSPSAADIPTLRRRRHRPPPPSPSHHPSHVTYDDESPPIV